MPTLVIAVLNTLVVATTWIHVASNAKAFRNTTPGIAKRRVRIFIWIMASFCILGFVLSFIIDIALLSLSAVVACVVVAIVYLVGSCKLQAVSEVKMNGEGLSSVPSTAEIKSWVGRSGGRPGGKKRHKHLETIIHAGENTKREKRVRESARAQRERGRERGRERDRTRATNPHMNYSSDGYMGVLCV